MSTKFELWQDGIMVAEVEGPTFEEARSEIMHHAMDYAQDGKVEIRGPEAQQLYASLLLGKPT
jgi:hypothetical protein